MSLSLKLWNIMLRLLLNISVFIFFAFLIDSTFGACKAHDAKWTNKKPLVSTLRTRISVHAWLFIFQKKFPLHALFRVGSYTVGNTWHNGVKVSKTHIDHISRIYLTTNLENPEK